MAPQVDNVAMTFAAKNFPQSTRSASNSWTLGNESSRSDSSWVESRYRDAEAPALALTDAQLLKIAVEAGQSLHWDTLQRDLLAPATLWKRKQHDNGDNVGVYTRTDTTASTYSVVAVSELPCCVQELREIFSVRSTADYMELMTALWDDQFLYGELLHDVEDPARFLPKELKDESTELSVRHAVFDRLNVFRRQEEWLYVDLVQDQSSAKKSTSFSRTLLSLHPDDLFAEPGNNWTQTHRSGSVLVGFSFDEEPSGSLTRLRMYAECALDANKTRSRSLRNFKERARGSSASQRMVKSRLQQMTQISNALLKILRRRRLGFQVLVDPKITTSSVLSLSVPKCGRCTRSFLMVKQKTCKLCGNIVCDKCSAKHERERSTRTRCCIDSVRVCHRCIARVDVCKYKGVAKSHLRPARVLSDNFDEQSNVSQRSRGESNAVLTGLLEDSLKTTTKERRASVIKVINCLIEQDVRDQRSMSAIALTAESSTEQAVQAMKNHLIDEPLPLDQCVLANAETRGYVLSPGEDAGASLPAVIPVNEVHRLQMVDQLKMKELEARPELSLICALASKELGCMASMITVVQKDSYHVVASSIGSQTGNMLPRHEGFCHQLIMDDKPLMVPHVQADVRFSNLRLVKDYNVNFYCGFPLKAEDNTVIGSVCCVDQHSRELTQSQYTALKRLAETASKVVQRNA